MAYLDSGTSEHNFIHVCRNKIRRIKQVTKNIDVHAVADDLQELIETFIMREFTNESR